MISCILWFPTKSSTWLAERQLGGVFHQLKVVCALDDTEFHFQLGLGVGLGPFKHRDTKRRTDHGGFVLIFSPWWRVSPGIPFNLNKGSKEWCCGFSLCLFAVFAFCGFPWLPREKMFCLYMDKIRSYKAYTQDNQVSPSRGVAKSLFNVWFSHQWSEIYIIYIRI